MKAEHAVNALVALGQEHRLAVFRILVQAGTAGIPAGQIADQLKIPSPTLSFHLTHLRHAGLVTLRREGRSLIYAAAYDRMNALMAFLGENCCVGSHRPRLPKPKQRSAERLITAERKRA